MKREVTTCSLLVALTLAGSLSCNRKDDGKSTAQHRPNKTLDAAASTGVSLPGCKSTTPVPADATTAALLVRGSTLQIGPRKVSVRPFADSRRSTDAAVDPRSAELIEAVGALGRDARTRRRPVIHANHDTRYGTLFPILYAVAHDHSSYSIASRHSEQPGEFEAFPAQPDGTSTATCVAVRGSPEAELRVSIGCGEEEDVGRIVQDLAELTKHAGEKIPQRHSVALVLEPHLSVTLERLCQMADAVSRVRTIASVRFGFPRLSSVGTDSGEPPARDR